MTPAQPSFDTGPGHGRAVRAGDHAVEAFPPRWPRSLTDPAAIRDNDWQAFRDLQALDDHWDRPGWTPGRRSYHWFVTFDFDQQPDLAEVTRHCQDRIAELGLDLVPPDGVHLTLNRLGFTDEVAAHQAHAVAAAARQACAELPALNLAIGPLAGSRGAVRFSVTPWNGLVDLHRRLRHAAASVPDGQPRDSGSSFRPHVSIAYSNRPRPAAPVIEAVASLRSLTTVEATVRSARLVTLRRDGRTYRWETFATVDLGAR